MPHTATILDAATRFLRTNPELLELACRGAGETGVASEVLLADVVRRTRLSAVESVAKEEVIFRAVHRRRAWCDEARPGSPPRCRRSQAAVVGARVRRFSGTR